MSNTGVRPPPYRPSSHGRGTADRAPGNSAYENVCALVDALADRPGPYTRPVQAGDAIDRTAVNVILDGLSEVHLAYLGPGVEQTSGLMCGSGRHSTRTRVRTTRPLTCLDCRDIAGGV